MTISYGWFLGSVLDKARCIELVKHIPNDGITEIFDGKFFDLYKQGTEVVVEPTDGGDEHAGGCVAMLRAEAKGRERGGSINYDLASYLELAKCILVEGFGTGQGEFRGYTVYDLGAKLASVRAALADRPRDAETLADLETTLTRALENHIVVTFGE